MSDDNKATTRSSGPVLAMDPETARRIIEDSYCKPHEGRIYDCLLGGEAGFAVDREFAKKQIQKLPDLPWVTSQNRQCLQRFVRYMLRQGVRQFVDLGSGLPTQANVHEVCDADKEAHGKARVVYIDHDPVAVAHGYLLLEGRGLLDRFTALQGDVCDPVRAWDAAMDTGLIDTSQPVGLIMAAVLHFVPDEAATRSVNWLRDQMPSGSFLAITHATFDGRETASHAAVKSVVDDYDQDSTTNVFLRTRSDITQFFGGWPLQEYPDLVWAPQWAPLGTDKPTLSGDMDPSRSLVWAGVARKPHQTIN